MTAGGTKRDRYTPPGAGATDEDLRHDVELTRQELGDTVSNLVAAVNVRNRTRARLRHVKATASQMALSAREHPMVLGALAVGVAVVVSWARR